MDHVDVGDLFQPLDEEVIDRAIARRAVIQFSGICPRMRDEFTEIASRKRGIREEDDRHFRDLGDRRQRVQRVERNFGQELIDDEIARCRDQDRVSVGVRPGDFPGSEVARPSRFRFDDELLTKCLHHLGSQNTHDGIANSACCKRHD